MELDLASNFPLPQCQFLAPPFSISQFLHLQRKSFSSWEFAFTSSLHFFLAAWLFLFLQRGREQLSHRRWDEEHCRKCRNSCAGGWCFSGLPGFSFHQILDVALGCFSFQMKLQLSALPESKQEIGQVWGSEIAEIEPKKSPVIRTSPVICVYLSRNYCLDKRSNSSCFREKKNP